MGLGLKKSVNLVVRLVNCMLCIVCVLSQNEVMSGIRGSAEPERALLRAGNVSNEGMLLRLSRRSKSIQGSRAASSGPLLYDKRSVIMNIIVAWPGSTCHYDNHHVILIFIIGRLLCKHVICKYLLRRRVLFVDGGR